MTMIDSQHCYYTTWSLYFIYLCQHIFMSVSHFDKVIMLLFHVALELANISNKK